jgi:two-component system nitrogen regulation response regulator GlnG
VETTNVCCEISLLLVDDDSGFRKALASVLTDDGHRVLDYSSPCDLPEDAALAEIGLLISDYEMPGENGFTFIDRFHRSRPEVPVVLITAYQTETVSTQVGVRPFLRVLWKPFQYDDLHTLIHDLCSGSSI